MPAKAKTTPKPTEYVVLERLDAKVEGEDESRVVWCPIDPDDPEKALSKDGAIRRAVGDREGAFKAIPLSSWKGGRVHAQTTLIDSKPLE